MTELDEQMWASIVIYSMSAAKGTAAEQSTYSPCRSAENQTVNDQTGGENELPLVSLSPPFSLSLSSTYFFYYISPSFHLVSLSEPTLLDLSLCDRACPPQHTHTHTQIFTAYIHSCHMVGVDTRPPLTYVLICTANSPDDISRVIDPAAACRRARTRAVFVLPRNVSVSHNHTN